ncbi:MAG: AAA family ATPase, partial [Deltaproteobacteria bacterium]|nr:AAA family ATPase [Deltaproteobacteria bacterium]
SALVGYSWPGNVRELQNVINRFLTINTIELTDKAVFPGVEKQDYSIELSESVEKFQKQAILDALKRNQWHIGKAATDLGLSRRTMQRRMLKYKLR